MTRGSFVSALALLACLSAGGAIAQNAPMQLSPGAQPPARPQQAAPAQPAAVPTPPQRPSDAPRQASPTPATAAPQATAPRTRAAPADTPAASLNPGQQAQLRRITEAYNQMREMSGQFVQVDADGARSSGRFFLTKPGRIRFQYDRPNPLDVIADGTDVVVRDRRLNTQDLYPLSQTPLRYLLNDRIDLNRDAKVVGVFTDQDMVSVTIEERTTFTEGQLTLYFGATDFALRQWTIVDARGNETSVSVSNVEVNRRNNPQLFAIDRTQMQGPRGAN